MANSFTIFLVPFCLLAAIAQVDGALYEKVVVFTDADNSVEARLYCISTVCLRESQAICVLDVTFENESRIEVDTKVNYCSSLFMPTGYEFAAKLEAQVDENSDYRPLVLYYSLVKKPLIASDDHNLIIGIVLAVVLIIAFTCTWISLGLLWLLRPQRLATGYP